MMKLAPLWANLKLKGVEQMWFHTGQHSDERLNGKFVEELGLPQPDRQLAVDHQATSKETVEQMVENLKGVLQPVGNAMVIVYGDTWSTLAGARAARALSLPLIHVESGLRSGNFDMPEESIRIEVDRLADVHWCPSEHALKQLEMEGVVKLNDHSIVVGDIMLDVFRDYEPVPHRDRGGIVVTLHRNTNVQNAAFRKTWLDAVCSLAEERRVIWPMHHSWWNAASAQERERLRSSKVDITEPVGHEQILKWCALASVVLTDSGGLQKEAYALGTPVAILRAETEWTELLNSNGVELFDPAEVDVIDRLLAWVKEREKTSVDFPPVYGDGKAGKAMAEHFVDLADKYTK